jgi:site-specific DNA-methyltransferase (adenine-specific)
MKTFADGRVVLHAGDSLEILPTLPENSVDAVVTDPPYHLTSGKSGKTGFMGKAWDGGDVSFRPDVWRAAYAALKPGGHLVAFAATRTYHRIACAIEDAGFEMRDQLAWVYGQGFPKSLDVSKAIDKAAGVERAKVRLAASCVRNPKAVGGGKDGARGATRPFIETARERGFYDAVSDDAVSDDAVSDDAVVWQGWGTALKPAWEPIVLARKPLSERTVAANVLRWGTGALNIDGCRVPTDASVDDPRLGGKGDWSSDKMAKNVYEGGYAGVRVGSSALGRWPADLIHDGSPEVLAGFPKTNGVVGALHDPNGSLGYHGGGGGVYRKGEPDCGSAARFFYCAKASAKDRAGSRHPTVKPVALMRWLARLVAPPGGVILDPFAGTGTTAQAALAEGFSAVLIERDPQYRLDIARRLTAPPATGDRRPATGDRQPESRNRPSATKSRRGNDAMNTEIQRGGTPNRTRRPEALT